MNIKNENKPVGGDEGDNASGCGGPGWPEACRREETIRKLLGRSEGERLKMGDVEEVALELGVSRATLYRLITALSSNANRRGAGAETSVCSSEPAARTRPATARGSSRGPHWDRI